MAKPRIILLGKLPPPLIGPAIATEVLLNSSLREDFEITHFGTNLNDSVRSMGRFGWRKLRQSVSSARKLHRLAKEKKAHLALVPVSQTTVGFVKDSLYILALAKAGVPVLIQLRGSNFKNWIDGSSGLVKRWVRFCLRKTVGVVVLGEKLRPLFAEFYPPEQIFVAPNGADFPALSGEEKEIVKPLRLLYLSNFLPGKGFDTLLEALAADDAFKTGMALHAYGAWDDERFREQCLEIIRTNNLSQVYLNDSVSGAQKWKALNSADAFVFVPRHPEGHPWAIVEAMAAGLPIISTDRGAITESVRDGENGFIVSAENPTELAERISYFCDSPEDAQKMGKSSRQRYESDFTSERMAGRYRQIFNEILSRCAE